MSIVEANKQFYRADLENLITSVTGFNSDCEEFETCLDSIWPLFSRRYPSTNAQDVKEKLLSFSDKFIFHGFPQKAKNVKTLTEVYERSEYFKEAKWDIVRVLLDLSYRPTDDLEDQDPVDLDALGSEEDKNIAPAFNWGEYLKEGWENFVLPDEESSLDLSISDSSFIETEPPTIFEIPQRPQLNLPPVDDKDEELNLLRRKQKYADLLSTLKQPEWWNVPNFRDKPRKELYSGRIRPEETFCYNWERIMLGTQTNLVVTSEYKMIRLLLWILGLPPNTSSPRIKVNNKMYFIKDNISITNLIPSTFKKSVQNRFMTPLKNLKVIIDFIDKVNSFKMLSQKVPNTYIMYANSLDSIVTMYRIQLKNIEDEVKKQETLCSLRRLYVALRTKESHWNDIFEFIVSVHNKAVYPEFENVKNWICSMKLLSVLYDQLETSTNYKKMIVLKLFIESFSSYLEIICLMMAGNFDSDVKQEFVISRKSDKNRTLEIHNYYGFVKSFRSGSYDFWKPFISTCHRAISSVYFLKKLKKFHNLSNMSSYDFLVDEFCKRLRSALGDFMPTEKTDESNRSNCLMVFSEDYVDDFVKTFSFCPQTRMFGDSFDSVFNVFRTPSKNIFRKSSLEKLSEDVLDAKLDVNMTNSVLKDVSIQMIKDYMLPAGFASSILLEEHKLLNVLRNIRNIYFLNNIQPFSIELFRQIKENQHWTYPWTRKLRNCLNEFHPVEFCDQFNFEIGDSKIQGLIGSCNVLSTLEFVKLNYYPEDFSMVFTDDIIEAYNHLFSFRLQLRYSYCLILALRLKDLKENAQNYEICRSLYSLKMWLLHTMTALYNYFVFIDEKCFDDKIIKACAEAKDLYTIQNAHMELILMYKKQCFLHGKECRKDPVLKIFRLCEELSHLWSSSAEGTLKENTIKSFEQKYLTSIESLASMLLKISSPGNVNFGILFNDIVNNMAVPNS